MGGTKKGIHHFLKWPPPATMPRGLGYSLGFVRISGLFIKFFSALLFMNNLCAVLFSKSLENYQILWVWSELKSLYTGFKELLIQHSMLPNGVK